MKKIDGRTESQTDTEWQHSNFWRFVVHLNQVIWKCQLNMSNHVGEKCRKLLNSYILSSKRGITPSKLTQGDDIRIWSVVHFNKVICKISAQCVKACRRKVRKTAQFLYSMFKKRHNSFILQKLTQSDDTRTLSVVHWNTVMCKISAQYVSAEI